MSQKEKSETRSAGRPSLGPSGVTPKRYLRVAELEWNTWQQAAESAGASSLSEYIRAVMNRAAKRQLSK